MIRKAEQKDISSINDLLCQVANVHYEIRPDIFYPNTKKYTDDELLQIINTPSTPIFVCEQDEKVVGYCFCVISEIRDSNLLKDRKTLYIDDLCVDKTIRRSGIGQQLLLFVENYAKEEKCDAITLNVWQNNDFARAFYDKNNFQVLKTVMEKKL